MMRGRFFRRVGCLFAGFVLFVILMLGLAISSIVTLINGSGMPASTLIWAVPLGGLAFGLAMGSLAWAARSLRRTSAPIGDLLEAAGRVSAGDYAVRVDARGPVEVRTLMRTFNDMAARLEDAETRRRTIMADVTHELRTPLSVIQGNLEGMIDGVYPADEANLKSLMDETRVLGRLIEDLRTLSLAESGALELRREHVDLGGLIGETAAAFHARAEAAGVLLEADLPATPLELDVDPARVHEVLSNLLTNALRHTPSGGSIRVSAAPERAGGLRSVVVTVADTGSGIAPEDLPRLFDRFYKRDSDGSGLGLSIARKLVEAHGGTIRAESSPDSGTRIIFTLATGTPDAGYAR